jgi:hypothetical protein
MKYSRKNRKNSLVNFLANFFLGISEKDLPKLFQRFTQLEQSYTREYEGSGLGLSICKELAFLMVTKKKKNVRKKGSEKKCRREKGLGNTGYLIDCFRVVQLVFLPSKEKDQHFGFPFRFCKTEQTQVK